jgi:NAD(P) transhydrogenase subunit alpha
MRVAVLREDPSAEPRVAATPETVRKLAALGAAVVVESGAGVAAGLSDARYREAGAEVASARDEALRDADLVLKVRRPRSLDGYKPGAAVVALMDPYDNGPALEQMAQAGLSAFSLELIPRITRAQVMDVLSSQANLAGYQAVIEAAHHFGRAMPMMMTAAGTVPAARVFVMGAGVAGLQAIATARRLGAVVSATDVRPAAKEQVASLGGKFIAVEDEEFKAAETSGGYAREMSQGYRDKQAALVRDHIAKQDIVITTALIPGRPAPKLVSREMVASMTEGSVIVDLAVERGGNVEGAVPGEVRALDGVTIVGPLNMRAALRHRPSAHLARNIYALHRAG